jgi:hypothetical protein
MQALRKRSGRCLEPVLNRFIYYIKLKERFAWGGIDEILSSLCPGPRAMCLFSYSSVFIIPHAQYNSVFSQDFSLIKSPGRELNNE